MNRDEIIRMAHEADCLDTQHYGTIWMEKLVRFAELVAAAEREACAKVCDLVAREIDDTNGNATYCAASIRAREQQ